MALYNVLSVDVEDFAHVSAYERTLRRAWWDLPEKRLQRGLGQILDLCAETGVRGTFYVLGWIARRYPDLIRGITRAGHEIGCHSSWHRLVYELTPQQFRQDLRSALHVLEDITGTPVTTYRAPSFSITHRSVWALDILREEGILVDSSVYPTFHYRYGWRGLGTTPCVLRLQSGNLIEVPLSVYSVLGYPIPVGGGGYLRLYPLRMTTTLMDRLNQQNRPVVCYLHPWELDTEQPRMRLGSLARFQHHVNQHTLAGKLRFLLERFAFAPMTVAAHAYLSGTEFAAPRVVSPTAAMVGL